MIKFDNMATLNPPYTQQRQRILLITENRWFYSRVLEYNCEPKSLKVDINDQFLLKLVKVVYSDGQCMGAG